MIEYHNLNIKASEHKDERTKKAWFTCLLRWWSLRKRCICSLIRRLGNFSWLFVHVVKNVIYRMIFVQWNFSIYLISLWWKMCALLKEQIKRVKHTKFQKDVIEALCKCFHEALSMLRTRLNIKTVFPGYGESHVNDKTVARHGYPHTDKATSLYWDGPQNIPPVSTKSLLNQCWFAIKGVPRHLHESNAISNGRISSMRREALCKPIPSW